MGSRRFSPGGLLVVLLAGLVLRFSGTTAAAAEGAPGTTGSAAEAEAVIRRVIERARAVGADTNAPLAVFDKLSVYETLASDGRVKTSKEKRYEVSIRRGMTHNKLVSVDGRRLSDEESAAQSEKERRWREAYAATRSGGGTERMDQILNEQLFARFELALAGRERVRGHDCVVVALSPKPDGEPPDDRLMDRVINLLHGRIWIDEAESEIVRGEVETKGVMRMWGGVLGSLESFRMHVDRDRGVGGIWFNRHLEVAVKGRKLFSPISMRARELGSGLRLVEAGSATNGVPSVSR